jgi:hypothetical protein
MKRILLLLAAVPAADDRLRHQRRISTIQPWGHDVMLTPDSSLVAYTVSAFRSAERAGQMCLFRCTELTAQSGYRNFAIGGSRRIGAWARGRRFA